MPTETLRASGKAGIPDTRTNTTEIVIRVKTAVKEGTIGTIGTVVEDGTTGIVVKAGTTKTTAEAEMTEVKAAGVTSAVAVEAETNAAAVETKTKITETEAVNKEGSATAGAISHGSAMVPEPQCTQAAETSAFLDRQR